MDLTDAYENGAYIPGAEAYPDRWAANAAAVRASLGYRARLDLAYGPGARNRFDLFLPEGAAAGLVMFVHGGYWRRFDKSLWSHLAAGPLAHGWAVAMPSYTLAPEVRIAAITSEIVTALTAACAEVAGPVVVTGHSAGGHLSARMRCRDVDLPDAVARRIARVVPISPVADLRPLLQTEMNADLRLDAPEAAAESPVLTADLLEAETVIWVGAEERPAFLDQARWLAAAWPDAALHIAPGRHHFDVIEGLSVADSPLTRAVLGG
ncbi:MAG: alpha/beta hydrolase [Rhodobacter sp.]|nr:alpha/beta hydrolase [Rhodobacter sp.]